MASTIPPFTLPSLALGCALAALSASVTASGPQANSLGMQFVRVPAGSFWMGNAESPESLARAYPQLEAKRFTLLADEGPVHQVHISKAFELGRHEVTVGQFRQFLQASGYQPESERDGTGGYGYNPAYDPATTQRGDAFEGRDLRYSWRNPGFAQGDDHPVVNITWNDAQALAAWRSGDLAEVQRLNDWVLQTRESAELQLQTGQMGRSLAEWLRNQHADDETALVRVRYLTGLPPTYPVAFALAAAHCGASTQQVLLAFGFGWAENMVQAALKSMPLGQSAGQRVLALLAQALPAAVEYALDLAEGERQAFTPMLAILSAQHETQYSRLFRS